MRRLLIGALLTTLAGWGLLAAAISVGGVLGGVVAAYTGYCRPMSYGRDVCIVDMGRGISLDSGHLAVFGDWLPDLSAVAYTSLWDGHMNALVRTLDGEVLSVSGSDNFTTLPRWSPDGTQVAYLEVSGIRTIEIAAREGDNRRTYDTGGREMGGAPVWSPNGTRLAYFTTLLDNNTQIWLLDTATGDSITGGSTRNGDLTWSPDGTRYAHPDGRGRVLTIRQSSDGQPLHEVELGGRGRLAYWLAWSPTDAHIAYVHQEGRSIARREYLELYHLETGTTRRLTQGEYIMYAPPVWSADGRYLVQPAYNASRLSEQWLLLVDAQTGVVRRQPVVGLTQFVGVVVP